MMIMKTILVILLFCFIAPERSHAALKLIIKTAYIDTLPVAKDSSDDKIFTKVEVSAHFPGGDKAWGQYLRRYIENNLQALTDDNQSGTCRVIFIVDKEGNVSNVNAITMRDSKLAEVAVLAIKNGPRWIPAMQNGRPVNAYRVQPVTFTISQKER
jgi:protein TonB